MRRGRGLHGRVHGRAFAALHEPRTSWAPCWGAHGRRLMKMCWYLLASAVPCPAPPVLHQAASLRSAFQSHFPARVAFRALRAPCPAHTEQACVPAPHTHRSCTTPRRRLHACRAGAWLRCRRRLRRLPGGSGAARPRGPRGPPGGCARRRAAGRGAGRQRGAGGGPAGEGAG